MGYASHSRETCPREGGERESSPQAGHFQRFAEWIPALRQAQGKLFAGMIAAWSALSREYHHYRDFDPPHEEKTCHIPEEAC